MPGADRLLYDVTARRKAHNGTEKGKAENFDYGKACIVWYVGGRRHEEGTGWVGGCEVGGWEDMWV